MERYLKEISQKYSGIAFQQLFQLLDTVVIFQKNMQIKRKKLFNFKSITDTAIWNSLIFDKQQITARQIEIFLRTNTKNMEIEQIIYIIKAYSSQNNNKLNFNDVCTIFVPREEIGIKNIINLRKKIYEINKQQELHYKIKDLMSQILIQIIEYEKILNTMKMNMTKYSHLIKIDKFSKQKIQQLFYNFNKSYGKQEVQILINHITKYRSYKSNFQLQRQFYSFLVPILTKNKSKQKNIQSDFNLQYFQKIKQTITNNFIPPIQQHYY